MVQLYLRDQHDDAAGFVVGEEAAVAERALAAAGHEPVVDEFAAAVEYDEVGSVGWYAVVVAVDELYDADLVVDD